MYHPVIKYLTALLKMFFCTTLSQITSIISHDLPRMSHPDKKTDNATTSSF